MSARHCLLIALLGGCATEVVGWRKDGTFVEGELVAREGEVLIIQEPFFSHDVTVPQPEPVRVPVSSLQGIRYDRPGAVVFALGALSAVLGVGSLSFATQSGQDRGVAERNGIVHPESAILGLGFVGLAFWQFALGIHQLEDADLLLGPAVDLPDIPWVR